VKLLELLDSATESFDLDVDFGSASAADYRRFLATTYGYVLPVERAVRRVPGIEDVLDPRRLRKHELLQRDLTGLGMTTDALEQLPLCPVSVMTSPEEALGWLYPIEHGTRRHTALFHRLALAIPGEVAYSSSFLKCYFGAAGEMWRELEVALALRADTASRSRRLLDAARTACEVHAVWHRRRPAAAPQTEARVA
jgi:heme oxygenase